VSSDRLVSFILLGKSLEDWTDEARRILRSRIDVTKEPITGVTLVSKRGSRKVRPEALFDLVEPITILKACDLLSEDKARELFPDLKDELITELPGRVEMHVKKPRKTKEKVAKGKVIES